MSAIKNSNGATTHITDTVAINMEFWVPHNAHTRISHLVMSLMYLYNVYT